MGYVHQRHNEHAASVRLVWVEVRIVRVGGWVVGW